MSTRFRLTLPTTPATEAWWREALEVVYVLEDGSVVLEDDTPAAAGAPDSGIKFHGLRGLIGCQELPTDRGWSLAQCGVEHRFVDERKFGGSLVGIEFVCDPAGHEDDDVDEGLDHLAHLLVAYHRAQDPSGCTVIPWVRIGFNEKYEEYTWNAGVTAATRNGISTYYLGDYALDRLAHELRLLRVDDQLEKGAQP